MPMENPVNQDPLIRGTGLLTETLRTIKDNTAVIAELTEIVRNVREGISRLPQSGDSRATDQTMADIKTKMEIVHSYVTALGQLPQQISGTLSILTASVQEEMLKSKSDAGTIGEIEGLLTAMAIELRALSSQLTDVGDIKTTVGNVEHKIDVMARAVDTGVAKADELSTWSRVKFPFIIGMITFVIWVASVTILAGRIGNWVENEVNGKVGPVMEEMRDLNDSMQLMVPPPEDDPVP